MMRVLYRRSGMAPYISAMLSRRTSSSAICLVTLLHGIAAAFDCTVTRQEFFSLKLSHGLGSPLPSGLALSSLSVVAFNQLSGWGSAQAVRTAVTTGHLLADCNPVRRILDRLGEAAWSQTGCSWSTCVLQRLFTVKCCVISFGGNMEGNTRTTAPAFGDTSDSPAGA
jgi:hypothetical protein